MPMCRRKHSAGSHPLVKAMMGMSPSVELAGSRSLLAAVAGSGMAVAAHLATVGMVICLRHLPVWITSGMFAPLGTPNPVAEVCTRVKLPCSSVSVLMMGPPDAGASHCVHAGLPGSMSSGVLLGMYTSTL